MPSRIGLQMDAIDYAGKLAVNLRDEIDPIAIVGIRIGHDFIAQLAEHHAEFDRSRRVVTVLVVEINSIEGGDGSLQSLKVLIENAGWSSALRVDQSGDIFPVAVVGGSDAESDSLHGSLLQLGHVPGKIRMSLIADVHSAGRQGKLTIEIQVSDAVYLDAPHDGLGKAGVFNFGDVGSGVLIERATAEDSRVAALGACGNRQSQKNKNGV